MLETSTPDGLGNDHGGSAQACDVLGIDELRAAIAGVIGISISLYNGHRGGVIFVDDDVDDTGTKLLTDRGIRVSAPLFSVERQKEIIQALRGLVGKLGLSETVRVQATTFD